MWWGGGEVVVAGGSGLVGAGGNYKYRACDIIALSHCQLLIIATPSTIIETSIY